MATAAARPLPVMRLVAEAYAAPFRHAGTVLRIAWLPIATIVALAYPIYSAKYQALFDNPPEYQVPPASFFLESMLPLVCWVLLSILLVSWFRFLLRKERPSGPFHLAPSGPAVRFLVYFAILGLAGWITLIVPAIFVTIPLMMQGPGTRFSTSAMAACGSIAAFVGFWLSRLSIMLPLIALGRRVFLADAIGKLKGNNLRFYAGCIATLIPSAGTMAVATYLRYAMENIWNASQYTWLVIVQIVLATLLTLIFASFLAFAYKTLFEDTQATPASASSQS